jgi:hypothetical protein
MQRPVRAWETAVRLHGSGAGVNKLEWQKAKAGAHRERELSALASVTWITPVRLVPGRDIFVVGVTSDAADHVKREYGVKV